MPATLDPIPALGGIYAAARDVGRWPAALTSIRGAAGASCSQVLFADETKRRIAVAAGIDPHENQRYNQHYGRFDPIPTKLKSLRGGSLLSCREALAEHEWRTDFFCEWADPNEVSDAVFLKLSHAERPLWFLALGHPRRSEPFANASLRRFLQTLAPHLVNAVLIGRSLQGMADEASAAKSSFDALGRGWILLSDTGRLMSANGSAQAMLRAQDGLALRHGQVVMADAAADAIFRRGVRAAAGQALGRSDFGSRIAVDRPSGAPPYLVRIMPHQAEYQPLAEDCSEVTMVIVDQAQEEANLACALSELYDLTVSEAQVALKVCRGLGLRRVAAERAVSVATARVQLQRVFQKTGAHRQSELIVLLQSLRDRP